ncbi:MAG: NmrA family NAD(P)-binding protein [Planctomycetes bacterium]|nr:NmrA family NAD(P)-binding protein [Planctomycetota bacterium]MCB9905524.1 NmrA family NAD(P)-binding protein [Planctomycetota bacterium]
MKRLLITGATGNQGGAAARRALARGQDVRVAGTRVDVLRERFTGAEVARLDLCDPSTFALACEGVDGVFLIRPPKIAKVGPTLNAFIDEAARAGVQHFVFSSVAGAERMKHIPHHKVERHLIEGSLPWTILRPGFFAQNFADAYRLDIVEDDRVYVPAADGCAAFIDTRDVGELAAQILAEPEGHARKAYWLTGPESLSFAQAATILTQELGREVRYERASALGYVRHLRKRHRLGWMQTVIQTGLHLGLRRGDAEAVSPQLAELLGRGPRSLRDFVRDHRERWMR